MKIGISYNPFDRGYARFGDQAFLKIAEHGFSAIDYTLADTGTELYSLSPAELTKRLKDDLARIESAGITVSQVHGPWRYPPLDHDEEHRRERMKKMKASIQMTTLLSCKYWVVHPIMPFGLQDLNTENEAETWALNIEFMSELLDFAKMHGITVCLENMPMGRFSIATPDKILKLTKIMNDEAFKICLDTGHLSFPHGLSVGDSVKALASEIKVLHVHDNMGDSDAHLCPTLGRINWQEFSEALKEIGFNGVFSLETSPNKALNDEDFESESKRIFKIAKEITKSLQ